MIRLRESLIVAALAVAQTAIASSPIRAQQVELRETAAIALSPDTVALRDTSAADSVTRENPAVASPVFQFPSPAGIVSGNALHLPSVLDGDTIPRRRSVAYSEWYSRRLTIHRYGSYVMLPLFVTQFVLGSKLLNQKEDLYEGKRAIPVDDKLRSTHAVVAGTVGALFVVNTTTGVWNLIESRHTEEGRVRRTIHALTMLTADAGFAYTGYLGSKATDRGPPQGRKHRNVALGSMLVSTAGAALMWLGN